MWWRKWFLWQCCRVLLLYSDLVPLSSHPCKIHTARDFSLFTLGISPPLSGKSQAFKYGAKIPLSHVENVSEGACILLDKFTDTGLRQHLLKYGGLAVITKDKMYDSLWAIIGKKEVGTLCRLCDGDSLTSNLGNNSLCQHWTNFSSAWRIYKGETLFVRSLSSHGFFTKWNWWAFPLFCCQAKGHDQKRNTGNIKRDWSFTSTGGGGGWRKKGSLEVHF